MDMQRDVTDQVLDVASKRAKCCIAPVPMANRWTIAYRPSAASFFLLLCSGAMVLLMAVIRGHHPGQTNLQKQLSNEIVH
ncbi:hypothetical protein T11_14408 [Trichinella zimbabwensis]|uniref:Uncharacterized protein n=1 Tax=Trichinella zimbabwensis TaxID=268475 RepID=A0A0V1HUQ5_9BILA|nr:hypothetical protein T11_14408 [Trichinella zimbabwensis]